MAATVMVGRPPAKAAPARLAAVGGAQFVAIAAIVARHYSHYLQPLAPDLARALAGLDSCEFFFAASGFFLQSAALRRGTPPDWRHAGRQLAKLYPLHAATMAFFALAVLVGGMQGSLNGVPLGRCLAAQAALVHAYGLLPALCLNYPSWFLSAIVGMYLAAPILAAVARPWPGLGIVAGLVVLLQFAGSTELLRDWTSWTWDAGVIRALPSFLFGMVLASTNAGRRAPGNAAGRAAILAGYACLAASFALMLAGLAPLLAKAALQWGLLAALVAGERAGIASWLGHPWLDRMGRSAFALFLLHAPVAAVLMNIVAIRLLHVQGAALVAALLATFVAALLAAGAYERWIGARLIFGAAAR